MLGDFGMWTLVLTLLWAIPQANLNPWQQASQRDDVAVFTREVQDSPLRELKAESVMPFGAETLWQVIVDTAHYADFMPYMEEARRITSDTDSVHYEYQRLNLPLVKKRDYVIKTTSEPDGGDGVWVHRWQSAPDIGPAPTKDAVRLTRVDGSWTLRRLDADHTHVTYQLYTDPGGSLPRWIANRANSQGVPDLMMAVRKRAQNPQYRR